MTRPVLSGLIFAFLAVAYAYASYRFHFSFAKNWSWSEMLINYQGGLVKRGLFGEVAYRLDSIVPAREFVVITVGALYLTAIGLMVYYFGLTARFAGLMLLFSPGGMLFPIFDAAAYGRKDAFVIAALAVALVLIDRIRRPVLLLVVLFALYGIAGAIVEIAWFYFPLVIGAWLWLGRDALPVRFRATATVAAAAYTLLCLTVSYFISRGADLAKIHASWAALYPNDLPERFGALCCLDFTLERAIGVGLRQMWASPRSGYLIGAALSAIPVLLLISTAWKRLPRPDWLTLIVAIGGMAAAATPLLLAADWGRYLHLLFLHAFLCLWLVAYRPSPTGVASSGAAALAAQMLVVVMFASSWMMVHFRNRDEAAVYAGPLTKIILPDPIRPMR